MGRRSSDEQTVRINSEAMENAVLAWIKANPEAEITHTRNGIEVEFNNKVTKYSNPRSDCFHVAVDVADGKTSLDGVGSAIGGGLDMLTKGIDILSRDAKAVEDLGSGDLRSIARGARSMSGTTRRGSDAVGDAVECTANNIAVPDVPSMKGHEPPGRR